MRSVRFLTIPLPLRAYASALGLIPTLVACTSSVGTYTELSMGDALLCVVADRGAVTCRIGETGEIFRPIESGATQVSAHWTHGCARMADGTARCWAMHQVVTGSVSPRVALDLTSLTVAEVPNLRSIVQVAAARNEGVVRTEDGSAYQFSLLLEGSPGTFRIQIVPRRYEGLSNVAAMEAGTTGIMMMDAHGNGARQGPIFSFDHGENFFPEFQPIRSVASGTGTACAIRMDGTVRCVGLQAANVFPQMTAPVPTLDGAVELAIGSRHICARMPDATVRCVGDNTFGQLGDGTTTSQSTTAVTVRDLAGVERVFAGNHRPDNQDAPEWRDAGWSCALRRGALLCWGSFADPGAQTPVVHTTPVLFGF